MILYRPFEMHCHTIHSDGTFTVQGLMDAASDYGFDGICLTDHNTLSGLREVKLSRCHGLFVTPGIEWTTFFGHLLVLGCEKYVDWRDVVPDTIDHALEEIHQAGGVCGIAHPFEYGAPISCGSCWEFHVSRWDLMDYIEIWNEYAPYRLVKNQKSIPFYDSLLQQGHHIAVTSGRDWHRPDLNGRPIVAATYLGLRDGLLTKENILNAISDGRTYITLGPELELKLHQNNTEFGIGDCLLPGAVDLSFHLSEPASIRTWAHQGAVPRQVKIIHNADIVAEAPAADLQIPLSLSSGWLRVEVWGTIDNGEHLLAMTSPVYIR